MLDINQSRFVDFQKVRIQETQQELPRGSIPRNLEIVLRAEAVEMVQAGDKCDFIGTLIAIPDVAQLAMESMLNYWFMLLYVEVTVQLNIEMLLKIEQSERGTVKELNSIFSNISLFSP